ncbi:MAG: DUF2461 domain-containing protein [Candidatus Gracilibacteria bacterium]|nr:DUF2461 domain-containing protein [Candidatus Gracilibacteria bacterium]
MKKISQNAFTFLEELKENNNREWFHEHKPRYLNIKKDLELFSQHWLGALQKIDTSLQSVDCKPYLFRIYRDARFAKGKPFKTNHGVLIVDGGKPAMHQRAGYFLNLEAGNCFLVGGAYMPDPEWLKNMRNQIVEDASEIKEILKKSNFKNNFELKGNQLKTAPRGFTKDHPDLELLRYKSMYAITFFKDHEVLSDAFFEELIHRCEILKPFDDYLNKYVKNG